MKQYTLALPQHTSSRYGNAKRVSGLENAARLKGNGDIDKKDHTDRLIYLQALFFSLSAYATNTS